MHCIWFITYLSPVCTGRWEIKELTSGKLFPQNLHNTTPALPHAFWSFALLELAAAAAAIFAAKSISICELSGGSIGSEWGPCLPGKCEDGGSSCGNRLARCGWANRCAVSRYFSVSKECDKMCLVNLLWWGNDAPQYIHGYIGPLKPLLLLLTLLFWSFPSADSCNQTKNKNHQLLCNFGNFLNLFVVLEFCFWVWCFPDFSN